MTEPFVAQLRTRGTTIELAAPNAPAITVRVEMPEVWDVVRLHASPDERALTIKRRALEALMPGAELHDESYVLKLNGWEVLDESASLAATGAVDGSIFLVTSRRRRPVR
ncbi:MAG TPA: hypothetical protein VFS59_02060 [Gemmatimonadaceae bacterium]|nr:hypothetical protein [Gemmatimonadaceae bacterium]